MTPKKQVSPAIRILRGEGDASARATHLEAATGKFLVATNERKYMSTKTNFKRVALVAIASLGLGVLSSVPSQANVSNVAVTKVQDGTLTPGSKTDTVTAAIISVTGFATTGAGDSITVAFVDRGTQPGTANARILWIDTATGNASVNSVVRDTTIGTNQADRATTTFGGLTDSFSVNAAASLTVGSTSVGYLGARFAIQLESTTATATAGTYKYTALVSAYGGGAAVASATVDFDIVVTNAATSTTIAPASSNVWIGTATSASSDLVISALATASATPAAYLRVLTYNAAGSQTAESVTATISGAGVLNFGGISGTSLVINADGDDVIEVRPDGRTGVATIAVSTTTRVFATKSMTFYAAAPLTLVASVPTPNFALGNNTDSIRVTAKDASGVSWSGAVYVYASTAADALIAGSNTTPTLCSWDANDDRHECTIAGNAAGTAKFKAINASTVAAATVTSNEVSAVVNTNVPATVKLSFDKATYSPGERARIYVTPLDSAGKEIAAGSFTSLLASGGVSTNAGISLVGSTTTVDSLTSTTIATLANSSSTTGAKPGSMVYTVFMPSAGGAVTISATGGTGLPPAGRVAVSATATVTDSGAAALAAVSSLATTVASLKTLITTLTNLVLKIQKKVKA